MSVTPASAHATAWAKLKSSVRLQWMPSRSSTSAALMPSHVLPTLISTRARSTPAASYSAMSSRAFAMVRLGVEAEARIHLGRHAPGDDPQDLAPEVAPPGDP